MATMSGMGSDRATGQSGQRSGGSGGIGSYGGWSLDGSGWTGPGSGFTGGGGSSGSDSGKANYDAYNRAMNVHDRATAAYAQKSARERALANRASQYKSNFMDRSRIASKNNVNVFSVPASPKQPGHPMFGSYVQNVLSPRNVSRAQYRMDLADIPGLVAAEEAVNRGGLMTPDEATAAKAAFTGDLTSLREQGFGDVASMLAATHRAEGPLGVSGLAGGILGGLMGEPENVQTVQETRDKLAREGYYSPLTGKMTGEYLNGVGGPVGFGARGLLAGTAGQWGPSLAGLTGPEVASGIMGMVGSMSPSPTGMLGQMAKAYNLADRAVYAGIPGPAASMMRAQTPSGVSLEGLMGGSVPAESAPAAPASTGGWNPYSHVEMSQPFWENRARINEMLYGE